MDLATAIGSGAAFGVLHGLGPDHCAALASLIVNKPGRRESARASFQFGLGHAAALGALGLAAAGSGLLIPEAWERAGEILAGSLLIVVGAVALLRRDARVVIHSHAHEHAHEHARKHTHTHADGTEHPHQHWHVHVGGARAIDAHSDERVEPVVHAHTAHRHPHAAMLVGGAFGLSGVRALTLALPPLALAGSSFLNATAFVAAFGVGVTLAMVAFGTLFQLARRQLGRRLGADAAASSAWIGRAIGAFAVGLGVYWIARNVSLA
jgi:ABC-type nickel/cobalt efflux system permease component RcnA